MKNRGFSKLVRKLITSLLVAGVILGAYAEKVAGSPFGIHLGCYNGV